MCPICFLLGVSDPFVFLGFPWPFSKLCIHIGFYWVLWASPAQLHYPSSLGFMGLSSTPYFLCFHYFGPAVAHSRFSISYIAHGLLFLSFWAPLSSFTSSRLIFFISWACDPLFLPFGLNEFSIYLPNSFLSVFLGFFFPLGLPKWTSTESKKGIKKYMKTPLEWIKNHDWVRGECPLLFRALYYVKTKAFEQGWCSFQRKHFLYLTFLHKLSTLSLVFSRFLP